MLEHKEYKGIFYLPDKPDKQISGILYFYPNETIRLELFNGCISESETFFKPNEIKTIFGMVEKDGRVDRVTVLDCYSDSMNRLAESQNRGIYFARYYCSYILLGRHLENKEDKVFYKIRVTFPHFSDWYRTNAIQFDCEDDYTAIFKTTQEQKTEAKKFILNEKESLILTGYSSFYEIKPHHKCLYEESFVELEASEKSDFFNLLITIDWFRYFYSFAAMTAMPFSEIYLYDDVANIRYPLFFAEEKKFVEKKAIFPYSFLFDFPKIEGDFEMIIQKWYEKRENSEPIIKQLISSATPTLRRFIKSSDFLTVIQAIEGYYNRFVKDNVALRDMITCLYATYDNVPTIVNNKPEVNQVVDSRHYYSHFLPEGKKDNVCKDFELFGLAEKLKPLLIGCILTLMSFENKEIEELLQDYYSWHGNIYVKTE